MVSNILSGILQMSPAFGPSRPAADSVAKLIRNREAICKSGDVDDRVARIDPAGPPKILSQDRQLLLDAVLLQLPARSRPPPDPPSRPVRRQFYVASASISPASMILDEHTRNLRSERLCFDGPDNGETRPQVLPLPLCAGIWRWLAYTLDQDPSGIVPVRPRQANGLFVY